MNANKPTKKIRIRVCIDDKGNWGSAGWGHANRKTNDSDLDDTVSTCDDWPEGDRAWYWIEVDVALPTRDETTIEGTVLQ